MCFVIPASPVVLVLAGPGEEDGGVPVGQVVNKVRPGALSIAVHGVGQAQVA
jgi:hypothetical protein